MIFTPSNFGSGPGCCASSGRGCWPFCACPINLSATLKPTFVRSPRFSVSAIPQICVTVSFCGVGSGRRASRAGVPAVHSTNLSKNPGVEPGLFEKLDG